MLSVRFTGPVGGTVGRSNNEMHVVCLPYKKQRQTLCHCVKIIGSIAFGEKIREGHQGTVNVFIYILHMSKSRITHSW